MPANEQEVQRDIAARGSTAPRVTPDMIDAAIVGETYVRLPSGKKMICELTLANGFTVIGEASVVRPENFDEEIGRKVSRANARDKIWVLEGYRLQCAHPADPVPVAERPSGPRDHLRPDGIPSRCDSLLHSAGEAAIGRAMYAVEGMGASRALTDAVTLLDRARNRVADHVEGRGETPMAP